MFLCHDCQRYLPATKVNIKTSVTITNSINYNSLLKTCITVESLSDDHLCKQYVSKRRIDKKYFDALYFTEDFSQLAKFANKNDIPQEPRLVIPFFDENNNLFALQGRALTPSKQRYITLIFDKEKELIFGLDRLKQNEQSVCVEGPIDSLFLKNGIAVAGSKVLSNKYSLNTIICLDNEPRNKEIVLKNKKYLENGFRVVIWPDSIQQKDINDMILQGIDVESIIEQNTVKGASGIMKWISWKKV